MRCARIPIRRMDDSPALQIRQAHDMPHGRSGTCDSTSIFLGARPLHCPVEHSSWWLHDGELSTDVARPGIRTEVDQEAPTGKDGELLAFTASWRPAEFRSRARMTILASETRHGS